MRAETVGFQWHPSKKGEIAGVSFDRRMVKGFFYLHAALCMEIFN